jgi:hypothetical protein
MTARLNLCADADFDEREFEGQFLVNRAMA